MHSDLERLLALQEADKVVMGVEDELKRLEPEIAPRTWLALADRGAIAGSIGAR